MPDSTTNILRVIAHYCAHVLADRQDWALVLEHSADEIEFLRGEVQRLDAEVTALSLRR